MIFKNTFKLLLSNFSLCYKVLFYKLIILLLALALAGTIGTPFLMHLGETQFFSYIVDEFALMFENINLGNIFICFKNIFIYSIDVFKSLDTNLLINAILSLSTFVVFYGFIGSFSHLATIECLNSNLSSKTKLSYFKCTISKMLKSLLMTLIKLVISLPYYFCVFLIFYYGFTRFDMVNGIQRILIPMLMFLAFVIVTGFHLTLVSGFAPSIIVNDEGVFKALKIGIKTVSKKFFKVLSTSIMIVLILTIVNLVVAVFSFFAGIIFTLPITYVTICLFKIVAFYECNGMRYYVGDSIRTPLRKGEQDKINKLKYIV